MGCGIREGGRGDGLWDKGVGEVMGCGISGWER